MSRKAPNKFIAPIVIAGITVGFLASAYKFVFSKPKVEQKSQVAEKTEEKSHQVSENP